MSTTQPVESTSPLKVPGFRCQPAPLHRGVPGEGAPRRRGLGGAVGDAAGRRGVVLGWGRPDKFHFITRNTFSKPPRFFELKHAPPSPEMEFIRSTLVLGRRLFLRCREAPPPENARRGMMGSSCFSLSLGLYRQSELCIVHYLFNAVFNLSLLMYIYTPVALRWQTGCIWMFKP